MMVATARAPWQNPRILSTLMLVFLAGAASGALWMQLGLHDKLHHTSVSAATTPRDAVLQKFKSELDLSPAQSDRIAKVLEDYTQYYQSLQDQLDDVRATGKTQILQILDPKQRGKFEEMMDQLAPQLQGAPSQ
jgi:Spy/CpxP family protein refolding chaperone